MNIKLDKIYFENFMSYDTSEYSFKNGIDIITGKNSSGKSTTIDALFFVLFGRPYRKVKLSSLVNKIAKKKLIVRLDFSIIEDKETNYRIIRGLKPNKFLISKYDEESQEYIDIQERASTRDYQKVLEEQIIKINETIFRQLISISANLPSSKAFMDLTAKEKEEIFQIITDTSIFSDIKSIISIRTKNIKESLKDLEYKRDILNSTINSQKITIEQAEKRNEDFQNHHSNNIDITEQQIQNSKDQIQKYIEALEKIKNLKEPFDTKFEAQSLLSKEVNQLSKEINDKSSKLNYIKSAEQGAIKCSSCQTINYLVDVDVTEKESLIKEIQQKKENLSNITQEYSIVQGEVDKLKQALMQGKRVKQSLTEQQNNVVYYESKLDELKNIKPVEIDYNSINENQALLKETNSDIEILKKSLNDLNSIDNLVGDNNIKGNLISQQIPLLNKEINYFLELFSLLDYHFIIDSKFKERIITRGEDLEFQSLSNGQKARISFSIMFAFLKLIEQKNGIKVNILMLDEVLDSSVDSNGREELLNILKSEFSDIKDILVISHNDQITQRLEMFNRIVSVKREKYSKLIIEDI